jgi:hypothetical protein
MLECGDYFLHRIDTSKVYGGNLVVDDPDGNQLFFNYGDDRCRLYNSLSAV